MDFEVTSVFSTQIGRLRVPDADALNQELQVLILAEEAKYTSVGRSNIGGWHSHTDFLSRPEAAVAALTAPGDPYGAPVRVRPEAGLLVIFPSWLYHWVHPYMGDRPRIAVSFNATAAARPPIESATVDTGESERQAGNVLTAPLHQTTMDASGDGWLLPRAGGERP